MHACLGAGYAQVSVADGGHGSSPPTGHEWVSLGRSQLKTEGDDDGDGGDDGDGD